MKARRKLTKTPGVGYKCKSVWGNAGAWPSGKAPDFGSGDRRFESYRPSHPALRWGAASLLVLAVSACSDPAEDAGPQPDVEFAAQPPAAADTADQSSDGIITYQGRFGAGQTFYQVLLGLDGVHPPLAESLIEAARPLQDLAEVKPGDEYLLCLDDEGEFLQFRQRRSPREELVIAPDSTGKPVASMEIAEAIRVHCWASGVVQSSLWEAALRTGIDPEVIMRLTDIFAWQVDFLTETRPGDRFTVLWEELQMEGEAVEIGVVLGARYENRGRVHEAVRYQLADGQVDYFDPHGKSSRLQFLRSPLNYRRISSGFSYERRHPILKKVMPHLGIDFAAKHGTPVVASGDGKVVFASRKGPNGKMVQIRHGSVYQTYYLHLSAYGRGVRAGARVKQGQVIGYVGSTGRSTGPHLDYRMKRYGTYVNPLKEKFSEVRGVPAGEQEAFQEARRRVLLELNEADASAEVVATEAQSRPSGFSAGQNQQQQDERVSS